MFSYVLVVAHERRIFHNCFTWSLDIFRGIWLLKWSSSISQSLVYVYINCAVPYQCFQEDKCSNSFHFSSLDNRNLFLFYDWCTSFLTTARTPHLKVFIFYQLFFFFLFFWKINLDVFYYSIIIYDLNYNSFFVILIYIYSFILFNFFCHLLLSLVKHKRYCCGDKDCFKVQHKSGWTKSHCSFFGESFLASSKVLIVTFLHSYSPSTSPYLFTLRI